MVEEIAFENGRISNFQWLVTLTLDRVIVNTMVHHSSTSMSLPNFIEIEETFCGRTDGHLRPTLLGRLRRVDLISHICSVAADFRCESACVPYSMIDGLTVNY